VGELLETIGRHRTALEASGRLVARRQARRVRELRELVLTELRREVDRTLAGGGALAPLLAEVEAGRLDPYSAIDTVRARMRLAAPPSA
jgi:putative protein kinase ArgK-like GTPase of G3E family